MTRTNNVVALTHDNHDKEQQLLHYLTQDDGLRQIIDAGLDASVFETPINGGAFQFGLEYYQQHKRPPTIEVLAGQYPGVRIPTEEPSEAVGWLMDSLHRRAAENSMQELLRSAAGDLHEDPYKVAAELERGLAELRKGTSANIGGPKLWNAADLKAAEQPRWLAKSRLPRGAVSLLVGDEGIGKSLLWVHLTAAVTTGKPLPEFGIPARDPEHVLLVITEDDWSTEVRPRLEVAGADLSMVRVICTEDDGSGSPTFPDDIHLIATADPAPGLVVVDAWLDTVPSKLNVKDAQQARQALHPWREVATSTGAAVLLLAHTNRLTTGNARDKYGATSELRKKARMALYASQDEHGHLVVGPEKANGTAPVPATQFVIESVAYYSPTDDHDGSVPKLVYAGVSTQTAREIVAESHSTGRDSRSETIDGWLANILGVNGPMWMTDLTDAANEAGFSKDQLKKAKRRLKIDSQRHGGSAGGWYSRLPGQQGIPTGEEL